MSGDPKIRRETKRGKRDQKIKEMSDDWRDDCRVGTARCDEMLRSRRAVAPSTLSVFIKIGSTFVGYKMCWVLTGGAKHFSFIHG